MHDRIAIPADSRRRYPRVDATGVEVVYESDGRMLVSFRADVSLRGLYIATPTPDAAGTPCVIRIDIPDRAALVMAKGVVTRADERGMAIRFAGMVGADRKRLAAFLLRRAGLSALPQLERRFKPAKLAS